MTEILLFSFTESRHWSEESKPRPRSINKEYSWIRLIDRLLAENYVSSSNITRIRIEETLFLSSVFAYLEQARTKIE